MRTFTEVKIFDNPKKVYKVVAKEIFQLTQDSTLPQINIALSGGIQ